MSAEVQASAAFPAPVSKGPVEWGRGRFCYSELPPYLGALSVTVNGGVPFFGEADFDGEAWDIKPLDALGRAVARGVALNRILNHLVGNLLAVGVDGQVLPDNRLVAIHHIRHFGNPP